MVYIELATIVQKYIQKQYECRKCLCCAPCMFQHIHTYEIFLSVTLQFRSTGSTRFVCPYAHISETFEVRIFPTTIPFSMIFQCYSIIDFSSLPSEIKNIMTGTSSSIRAIGPCFISPAAKPSA